LLYQNFITAAAQLSATSLAQSELLGVTQIKAGSAAFSVRGVYTGTTDVTYVVEVQAAGIDTVDVIGGIPTNMFHGMRFRWSDTGGVTWNVEQVLADTPGQWLDLNFGVQVSWTRTTAVPSFYAGDRWIFRARLPYGLDQAFDLSRNTEVRSGVIPDGATWALTADFGVPVLPQALALLDHNLLATSTLRLQTSSTANFAALIANEVVSWQAQKRCYLPQTGIAARYWRIQVTAGVGQGDVRLGEIYLGPRLRIHPAFRTGYTRRRQRLGGSTEPNLLASGPSVGVPDTETYELTFGHRRAADRLALETLWQSLNDWTQATQWPFYFVPNDADLSTFGLYHLANNYEEVNVVDGISEISWQLVGVARSLL